MMIELPSELKNFLYKKQFINFIVGVGTISQTSRYSRTIVNGSDNQGTTVDVLDIWVKTDDGNDVNCQLVNPNVGFREQDRVFFLLAIESQLEAPKTVVFFNNKTGEGYSWHVTKGLVKILLKDNPSGLFKNPRKNQEDFEEALHQHTLKIQKYSVNVIQKKHLD